MNGLSYPAPVKRLISRLRREQKFRYIVIGIWNTGLSYGIFSCLYYFLHNSTHYTVIYFIAHVVAVTGAFLGHKLYTFRSKGPWVMEYCRFNVAYLCALVLGMAGMPFLVEVCLIHPVASQILLALVMAIASYFVHQKFSFISRP